MKEIHGRCHNCGAGLLRPRRARPGKLGWFGPRFCTKRECLSAYARALAAVRRND